MIHILSTVGGFDICAMTGVFIGAASERLPVVIDGYISVVAALSAYMLAPGAQEYMFASHGSWGKGIFSCNRNSRSQTVSWILT